MDRLILLPKQTEVNLIDSSPILILALNQKESLADLRKKVNANL